MAKSTVARVVLLGQSRSPFGSTPMSSFPDKSIHSDETSNDLIENNRNTLVLPTTNKNSAAKNSQVSRSSAKKHERFDSTSAGKSIKKARSDSSYSSTTEHTSGGKTGDVDNFDLCTPEGQLAAAKARSHNGKVSMTWEQAKHAARREYNRVNAARARQRHKETAETRDHQITTLQDQVDQLTRVNQMLINYICELQAAPTAKMATSLNASTSSSASSSIIAALSALTEASKAKEMSSLQEAARHQLNVSELLARIQQKSHAEESLQLQDAQASSVISNIAQALNGSALSVDNQGRLYQFLRGQDIASPSLNPIAQSFQTHSNLAHSSSNRDTSHPWNVAATMNSTQPSSDQQVKLLWDVLMTLQGSNPLASSNS